jgi:Terminase large subunit, T4likevirus-type, N-terminal
VAVTEPYLVTPLGVHLALPYTRHYPHPPQEAFLWLDCEEALYGGAARGGKTDTLLNAALQYIHIPGYAAIILRRISPDLHGADGLVPRSKEWLLPHLGERAWNGERLSWAFPSGATLRFGHMQYEDDKFKYQGHAYNFVGFDEVTHFTESQYRYLFSRLTRPAEGPLSKVPVRMRAASNPGGPGHEWVKRRFIDRIVDPTDPEDTEEKARARIFIPARVEDNPSIDREAYVRSLSHLEPETRKQLLDGDWETRPLGDWYFTDKQVAAIAELGREYKTMLLAGRMPEPAGGLLHLGIDWGESTHAVLGWPLEGGGIFIVREFVGLAGEPGESTVQILDMNTFGYPLGRARYDAAGIQSMRTFKKVSRQIMGPNAPRSSRIAFGSTTGRAQNQKRSYKGEACMYLRRLARRAHEGHVTQILAVSPDCPVLLGQLKKLPQDPENTSGAWLKEEDQHGPDATVALVAPIARRHREAAEGSKRTEEKELA